VLSPYQFNPLNYNPLKSILEGVVDFERLRSESAIKLFLCATNVRTGSCQLVIIASRSSPKSWFTRLTISVVLIRGSTGEALPSLTFVALFACGETFKEGGVEATCANEPEPLASKIRTIPDKT
jgi:hypothetical protein